MEHQIVAWHENALAEIKLRVEIDDASAPSRVAPELEQALHSRFSLRIPVEIVPSSTLPRHELKARRLVRV